MKIIKSLWDADMKQVCIAQHVGRSKSVVSRWIRKKVSQRSNSGRKNQTTAREYRILNRIVSSNRFSNAAEMSQEWNASGVAASRSTTFRRLQEMGYRSRVPACKPLLTKKQHQKRLNWAKEHASWTVEEWSKVLFSDESRFCLSFGNQGCRVWRKIGEQYKPSCTRSSVKFPQSVMVWGAMSAVGVGHLCFLKTTVNASVYQEVLEHFMLPSSDQLFGEQDFTFQHDLAPAHSAKSTKKWFEDHGITVLSWPANSPDLNVIENLWGIMKRKLQKYRCSNLKQLKASIEQVWKSVTPEDCGKLVASMPLRIQAVIEASGAATKY